MQMQVARGIVHSLTGGAMPVIALPDAPAPRTPKPGWAGYLIGFSLGGFFDGILLHQILQWHHLLSNVRGGIFDDLRVQVLADGLFHALMYVVAFAGLVLLWRARKAYAARGGDQFLLAAALTGFGAWHIVDALLSHWVLGIHRIRPDSANPLFWDMLWLAVFGLGFLGAGILLHRRAQQDAAGHSSGKGIALMLALSVTATGPIAAMPPAGADNSAALVFFRPGTSANTVFEAIDAAQGRVLWANRSGDVWAVHVRSGQARTFYRYGAYLVSNSGVLASCIAWSSIGR
jgi:uncharacterized membrane protein